MTKNPITFSRFFLGIFFEISFLDFFFEISFLKNDFSETPSAQSTAVVESAHRLNAMTTAVNAIGEVPAAAASLLGNSFIFKVSFHTVVARFATFLSNLATGVSW